MVLEGEARDMVVGLRLQPPPSQPALGGDAEHGQGVLSPSAAAVAASSGAAPAP